MSVLGASRPVEADAMRRQQDGLWYLMKVRGRRKTTKRSAGHVTLILRMKNSSRVMEAGNTIPLSYLTLAVTVLHIRHHCIQYLASVILSHIIFFFQQICLIIHRVSSRVREECFCHQYVCVLVGQM